MGKPVILKDSAQWSRQSQMWLSMEYIREILGILSQYNGIFKKCLGYVMPHVNCMVKEMFNLWNQHRLFFSQGHKIDYGTHKQWRITGKVSKLVTSAATYKASWGLTYIPPYKRYKGLSHWSGQTQGWGKPCDHLSTISISFITLFVACAFLVDAPGGLHNI